MAPTAGGLLVALVYAVAAWLSRRAARRLRRDRHGPAAWTAIALALALLAILRLFGVEELVSRAIAARAGHAGWYRDRAPVQQIAVAVAAAIGFVGVGVAAVAAWRSGRALGAAAAAAALLCLLAALHVISLHATDHVLAGGWGPLTASRLIEAAALAVLLVAAAMTARAAR